jgi:rubrerythrin
VFKEARMELFDIAIQMEKEGETFYHDIAKKAATQGFRTIFNMLADDEASHRKAFEAMKKNIPVAIVSSTASEKAEVVFETATKEDFLTEQSQLAIYERALEIELKSIEFYSEQIGMVDREDHQEALEMIILEERMHYDLIDDIIVMVERPGSWVEHAEFGVREDY